MTTATSQISSLSLHDALPILALIWFIVSEREGRARAVISEVAALWGGQQQISGPFLVVPYMVKIVTTQGDRKVRSEEHTSELQSQSNLVCRLLLEKKNQGTQE